MALLDRSARVIADAWRLVGDEAELSSDAPAIISLARLKAGIAPGRLAPIGVVLEPGALVEEIERELPRLSLVCLRFNKFRDGRAFTQARGLRERYGFGSEIRAIGHVLPDQFLFLLRCGFSTVQVEDETRIGRFAEALALRSVAYQPAPAAAMGENLLLRHLRAAS